jgi:hypothetical protein
MKLLVLLASVIATPLLTCAAQDHLTPIQHQILAEPASPRIENSFSFDAPARPTFTEAEQEEQRERAWQVLSLIREAFNRGAAEVRVPPGDYRFGKARWRGATVIYPLGFEEMQRDSDHPFIIDATGATFWFEPGEEQLPAGHRAVGFRRCRNIVLRGATLDRGLPGLIEGRITRIDSEGNRFEIQPSAGIVVPTTFKGGDEQRLIPFKSDGRFCAPLYDLQPGTRRLTYKGITPSSDGRYWVTMRDPDLIQRIHDPEWERTYGELGVLRVGDGLSCLYTGIGAITIEDSANITIHRVHIYMPKGGVTESGGDGAHLWKDCYLGPRPGTHQWKGADGYLCRSTRHGSIVDHVTLRHTADDLHNYHGIWGRVKAVSGNTVTFETDGALLPTLANARPDDRLRFIDRKTGAALGEARITALEGHVVALDQEAARFAGGQAEWLDHRCAGWIVQRCTWEDCFQRLLVMSGPGTVRGCVFVRWGAGLDLNTGMGLVGGVPSDITIADNTFVDVNTRPNGSAIKAHAHNAKGDDGVPPIERLVIVGNTFTGCRGPAISLRGVHGACIENNRFESPLPSWEPISLQHCTSVETKANERK